MQQKVWNYFDQAEQSYGTPWPIRYRWPGLQRLRHLRRLGLRAVPALTYPHKPGMADWLNQWNAQFANEHSDVLRCATFYPEPGAAEVVRQAVQAGARLFKAHVQVGEYDPTDRLLDPVWGQLADQQIPVVIHAGSAPLRGQHTGAEPIARLLDDHPSLVLVIAHMGMPEYHEFADLAEQYDGVHLDTTLAFTDFAESLAPVPAGYRARLAELRDKIVLGSDFPNIPHPYADQVEALVRLGLGDQWLRHVLWRNGARLMGLSDGV